jgi:hypothetical protein
MEESDKIIYHYTSLEGFLGIIESKSIWATNILYLNDASELNYSGDLLREQLLLQYPILIKRNPGIGDMLCGEFSTEDLLFKIMLEVIDNRTVTDHIGFFVCSFSDEMDLLSQWRGYCPKGIGFSLGFKFNKLKECSQRHEFSIWPCIYDKMEQIAGIKKLIELTSDQIKNSVEKDFTKYDAWATLVVYFLEKYLRIAPFYKHPKFKEEKECRIIKTLQSNIDYEILKYRPGKSMIYPYIEIPLPKEGDNLIINKIVVGPTHDPLLSKASVEMLLRSKKVIFDEVLYSTIPYRNW